MRLRIVHTSSYAYSDGVFLETQMIRMAARSDGAQRLLEHDILIDPAPQTLSRSLDAEGNVVLHAWFAGVTDRLHIRATSLVETVRSNPYDFLLDDPLLQRLPVDYGPAEAFLLSPYLAEAPPPPRVASFSDDAAAAAGGDTLAFLTQLNERIHSLCAVQVRRAGAPRPPEMTLRQKRGACRDLAQLFVIACRRQGLAARFVSGYLAPAGKGGQELHAWGEVYLPTGGWRGYDPTLGLATADGHVAAAASAYPERTLPVGGAFRGSARAKLRTALDVQVVD